MIKHQRIVRDKQVWAHDQFWSGGLAALSKVTGGCSCSERPGNE